MVGRYIWSRSSQSVEIKSGILSMSKHSLVIVLSCTWSTVVGIMDMRLACKCPGDDSRGGGEAKPLNLVISSRLYDEACCLARHLSFQLYSYDDGKLGSKLHRSREEMTKLSGFASPSWCPASAPLSSPGHLHANLMSMMPTTDHTRKYIPGYV